MDLFALLEILKQDKPEVAGAIVGRRPRSSFSTKAYLGDVLEVTIKYRG